ncbi:MAG: hypothetical protein LBJ23_09365, partial [Tannerella sp.]|nr:hypothetical protein [Tannerella sp.]
MKTKVVLNSFWWPCACLIWALASCSEEYNHVVDPDPVDSPDIPAEVLKVNNFVYSFTHDYYLWMTSVDWQHIYPDEEADAFAFFEKLKYGDDKWSMLTDDLDELEGEFAGTVTSFGYTLIFGQYSNSEALFAIVLYVYPGTPADRAGLKRGDFIVGLNGGDITRENRMELYDAPSLFLTPGT